MSFSLSDFPVGSYWKRSDIHALLGGQEQGGISTPSKKPYIIIFSSPRGEEFGYEDGRNPDGFYHYTGEGQVGDMQWVRGNRAIRDHAQLARMDLAPADVGIANVLVTPGTL